VAPGGLAGAPQLSVPASRPAGALPVGFTLEGGIGADARLLAVGEVLASLI
jgi:Asp-tRNA(Asn)/Glu-tRNA(Gln) amidotransferase A subunit family amidase